MPSSFPTTSRSPTRACETNSMSRGCVSPMPMLEQLPCLDDNNDIDNDILDEEVEPCLEFDDVDFNQVLEDLFLNAEAYAQEKRKQFEQEQRKQEDNNCNALMKTPTCSNMSKLRKSLKRLNSKETSCLETSRDEDKSKCNLKNSFMMSPAGHLRSFFLQSLNSSQESISVLTLEFDNAYRMAPEHTYSKCRASVSTQVNGQPEGSSGLSLSNSSSNDNNKRRPVGNDRRKAMRRVPRRRTLAKKPSPFAEECHVKAQEQRQPDAPKKPQRFGSICSLDEVVGQEDRETTDSIFKATISPNNSTKHQAPKQPQRLGSVFSINEDEDDKETAAPAAPQNCAPKLPQRYCSIASLHENDDNDEEATDSECIAATVAGTISTTTLTTTSTSCAAATPPSLYPRPTFVAPRVGCDEDDLLQIVTARQTTTATCASRGPPTKPTRKASIETIQGCQNSPKRETKQKQPFKFMSSPMTRSAASPISSKRNFQKKLDALRALTRMPVAN